MFVPGKRLRTPLKARFRNEPDGHSPKILAKERGRLSIAWNHRRSSSCSVVKRMQCANSACRLIEIRAASWVAVRSIEVLLISCVHFIGALLREWTKRETSLLSGISHGSFPFTVFQLAFGFYRIQQQSIYHRFWNGQSKRLRFLILCFRTGTGAYWL